MSAVPTLGVVALDCPDPVALAEFYRAVLEWEAPEVVDDGHWATLRNPAGGAGLAFQRVPGYRPPAWPSAENPQQLHLDLNVTDLEAAHERVLGLGAKLLDDQPKTFRVYADPVGHPFCLCAC
ncbi:VOC family protein [Amycolatopsis balhimycina DSM 5908]|uniref:VOC family protein n=1 Tax=Amycolatopsis balhimycina DSM 5908 TaxID=1081091 RepID=A0A428W846_AMYBA|nr:VOC family protein [Amycolatopsis balhimycina]RSM39203.1 VOC family protein [Amycolatopsis balhimycina DSM 5908]